MAFLDLTFGLAKQGGTAEDITLFTLIFSREQEEAAQSSNSDAVILVIKKMMRYEEERRGGRREVYIPVHPAKPALGHAEHVLPILERAAT